MFEVQHYYFTFHTELCFFLQAKQKAILSHWLFKYFKDKCVSKLFFLRLEFLPAYISLIWFTYIKILFLLCLWILFEWFCCAVTCLEQFFCSSVKCWGLKITQLLKSLSILVFISINILIVSILLYFSLFDWISEILVHRMNSLVVLPCRSVKFSSHFKK